MRVVPRRRLRLRSRGLQCLTIRIKPGDGTTRARFYAENGAGECVSPLYSADGACAGFTEGYKTVKGDMVIVPICPIAPITPIGSTDFREGIKAGIKAASRR